MELSYTQENFTGSLSKISPDKFQSLLHILNDNILSEMNETAKNVLEAIDKNKIENQGKPGSMPSDVISLFKMYSLDGRFSVGCYMVMKQWYESFRNGEGAAEAVEDKEPKKPTQRKAKEVEEKIKEVKTPDPEEAEEDMDEEDGDEGQDTSVGEYDDDDQDPPFDGDEEVIEESVDELQPQPEAEIVEEKKKEPEKKEPEKKETAPAKEKKKSAPKKKKASTQKVNADLLSIDPKNIEIYDITPETHPQMFLEFGGEFISKRVTETKSWRPNHPALNTISNELLKEVVDVFMDRWVTYADVMKMVDQMTCAYTSYTAKRIWWMVKYNEFIRYSLVKETRGYGEEAYRLVQRWVSHPMVSFALEEWKKANKKK